MLALRRPGIKPNRRPSRGVGHESRGQAHSRGEATA